MSGSLSQNPSLPWELIEDLKRVGTPTAAMILMELGLRNGYMSGIDLLAPPADGQRMVGIARTVRFTPLREDLVEAQYANVSESPHRKAIESIEPGEVLVVDTGGSLEAGVAGDNFSRRILMRGGVGLIVDGAIRDLSAIRTVGLSVYARGTHGAPIPRALMSVGMDEPIRCGGLTVVPGDVILGDEDGLVAIPRHVAEKVAKLGLDHERVEEFTRMKLSEGASIHDVYPPTGESKLEMERWLARKLRAA